MSNLIDIGVVLGGTYEIMRLLGRGGMGAVWEARHLRLPGKRVAIKVLLGDRLADPSVYTRFRREAEIASRLGHPNIIEAIDFNVLEDGTPYIVLEFLEGETLAARIRRGPFAIDEMVAVVRQIGSALAAAHRAGVVHRDLKPDNVYLLLGDSDGKAAERVKVLDFGISKIRDSQSIVTSDQSVLGTPQYMSPEQASAKHGEVDARTDQFALGAMVYEMLAGQAAFAGPSLVSVVYKVMAEQPEPLTKVRPQVPQYLAAAVDRALSKKPEDRYPDVAAFVEALTAQTVEASYSARADGLPRPSDEQRAGRKGPYATRAAVLLLSVIFTVGVAAVTARLRSRPPTESQRIAPIAASKPTTLPDSNGRAQVTAEKPDLAESFKVATPEKVEAIPSRPHSMKPEPRAKTRSVPVALVAAKSSDSALDTGPPELEGEAKILADLDLAEKLLDRNTSESIRIARRTLTSDLTAASSARAYSIVARAFCREGNLGNANAQMAHVGTERAKIERECEALGVSVQ